MLQKGFLKSKKNPEDVRTIKRSRLFFIGGVVVAVSALIYMMYLLQPGESITSQLSSVKMAGMVMIAGMVLIFVGLWMNYFTQTKNRR